MNSLSSAFDKVCEIASKTREITHEKIDAYPVTAASLGAAAMVGGELLLSLAKKSTSARVAGVAFLASGAIIAEQFMEVAASDLVDSAKNIPKVGTLS